jgi:DNA-binding transcriptional ArsR family regulator
LFGVIADRSRRRVFELLLDGERTVGELVRATRLRQPLVSHHLKVLRLAGLIAVRKEGRFRYYRAASGEIRGLFARLEADAAKLIEAAEALQERSPGETAPRPRAAALRENNPKRAAALKGPPR